MSSSSEDDIYNFTKLQKKIKRNCKQMASTSKVAVKKQKRESDEADKLLEEYELLFESDDEDDLEHLIKRTKRKAEREQKHPSKPVFSDIDEIVEVPIPEKRKIVENSKKSPKKGKYQKEWENLEKTLKEEDMERKKAMKEYTETFDEEIEKPRVILSLQVLHSDDFLRLVKVYRDEQFVEKIFLKHAAEAGYDDPESFNVYWDQKNNFKLVNFYDTPDSIQMPDKPPIHLFIAPKTGVVREARKENDIKLKFNLKGQKDPVAMLIDKDMKFGDFIKTFATEHKLDPTAIHFVFDSSRVHDNDTPTSLEMEDFDVLDVMLSK